MASGSPTSARERVLVRWDPNRCPMMSEAKIRPSASSVGKNSTVQSQSLSVPVWLEIMLAFCSQNARSFGSQKFLARNPRYKDGTKQSCSLAFLAVPYAL